MNKAQAAALFLAGATAGVGGMKITAANEPPPQVRVHALDLRRGAELPDGGYTVSRVAYGTLLRADGGARDIGQAKQCGAGNQTIQRAMLDLAAAECEWAQ